LRYTSLLYLGEYPVYMQEACIQAGTE